MIKVLIRWIRDLPDNIKWFVQRGKRGWADCDVWGMDYYLVKVIHPMLRRLRKIAHGHPCGLDTPGEWDKILDEMIEGFEAAKRVCDDDYLDKVQPGWFDPKARLEGNYKTIKKESILECARLSHADQKLFEQRMELFTKWFFNLWD
uniref:Uncharacterized protein n=1 Tax=viral metagenome TaxID=1070528 RepID=A0A6H2A2Q0_9ZZZZ